MRSPGLEISDLKFVEENVEENVEEFIKNGNLKKC